MRRLSWFLALSLAAVQWACAKYVSAPLKTMAETADAIALVHVDEIVKVGEVTVAKATVFRPFHNLKAGDKVAFLAQPTWMCDGSRAELNEMALIFFQSSSNEEKFYDDKPIFKHEKESALKGYRYYHLGWYGWGRFPGYNAQKEPFQPAARLAPAHYRVNFLYFREPDRANPYPERSKQGFCEAGKLEAWLVKTLERVHPPKKATTTEVSDTTLCGTVCMPCGSVGRETGSTDATEDNHAYVIGCILGLRLAALARGC